MMYLAVHVLTGLTAYALILWAFRKRHDATTMYRRTDR